jgi:hypothetical protein
MDRVIHRISSLSAATAALLSHKAFPGLPLGSRLIFVADYAVASSPRRTRLARRSGCGAPGDPPGFAEFLVACGIDSLSATPDSFIAVKRHVAAAEGRGRKSARMKFGKGGTGVNDLGIEAR